MSHDDRRIAFLTANEGVEQSELIEPWRALEDLGAHPELLAPQAGEVKTMEHLEAADAYPVDGKIADANPDDYAMVVLPGGVANPDALRLDTDAIHFIRSMADRGAPIAAICHAPWLLIDAGVARGRMLTSWPSLRTDITNAGGQWENSPVVVCRHGAGPLITSRKPDDLAAFNRAIAEALQPILV